MVDGKKNSLMVETVAAGVEPRDERWETPRGHGGGGGKCETAADVPTGIQEFSFSLSLNIFRGRNASAWNVPAFQRADGRAERYGFILAAVPAIGERLSSLRSKTFELANVRAFKASNFCQRSNCWMFERSKFSNRTLCANC